MDSSMGSKIAHSEAWSSVLVHDTWTIETKQGEMEARDAQWGARDLVGPCKLQPVQFHCATVEQCNWAFVVLVVW